MISPPMIVHRYVKCPRCGINIERASIFAGPLPVVEDEDIKCTSCEFMWVGKFEYEGKTTTVYEI